MTTPSKQKKTHLRLVAIGVLCLLVLGGLLAVQSVRADGRILPNVSVGGVDVGGLTPEDAKERLRNALRGLNVGGLSFTNGERSMTIRASETSAAPTAQSPITYDIDASVSDAFGFGHNDGAGSLLKANLIALFSSYDLKPELTVDRDEIERLLKLRFIGLEQPARNAEVSVTSSRVVLPATDGSTSTPPTVRTDYQVSIAPESEGRTFDYAGAISEAASGLERWQGAAVVLAMAVELPTVTVAKAEAFRQQLLEAAKNGPMTLAYDDLTWPVPEDVFLKALSLKGNPDGSLRIGLRSEFVNPIIAEAGEKIETSPAPTRMTLNEDKTRVVEFEGGSIGKRINLASSLALIDERVAGGSSELVPLVVDITPSSESDPVAEELGIRELLGYGTSNFSGSPNNRRKNIANGVNRLYGIIIKPGEELGLLEHLRPFDASGGYVQELVIKEKRTVPEFGGGLCQIGTTTFRATMAAGLPITQRQNHSYRVRYYEPAGTDATLYDPAPDYRFVNDTDNHVVLIAKTVGKDTLRFELWGTRDGRVQKQSKVKLWNVVQPPPPKLIETSELPEGTKKCFEVAHQGATTAFNYAITYPDGRVADKEFRSVYKPWQEQCLVGKAGAPRIVLARDGALKELPPVEPASGPAPGGTQAPSIP